MQIKRRKTITIKVGNVYIGSKYPVAVQSMAKFKTSDIDRVVSQIEELRGAGCEIVRLAIKDNADALAIKKIKEQVRLPLVADIHFDYRLALKAIGSGVDKIRLNPGNIYKKEEIREVVAALKDAGIPMRIGLNSGSVKGEARSDMPDRLVRSALDYIKIIEGFRFRDIIVSLKASDVLDTIEAYKRLAKFCDYPFHLGVTATGSPFSGAIKSSIALGALLLDGIGDTIRVSLTDKPIKEIYAAKIILESLDLRRFTHSLISCPTCGRCEVDLIEIVKELEEKLQASGKGISPDKFKSIAVMGCIVNGPGEAKEADVGIAFGKKDGLLFKKGKAIKKVSYDNCVKALMNELES
jgi:(E)-4-hydroxy-3-methylbut-2-enyl-diphosphate synthase